MELLGIAVIILILAGVAATISALRKDGLGHNPPVRSEEYWMARDLPSINYTLPDLLSPRTLSPHAHRARPSNRARTHAPGPAPQRTGPRQQPDPAAGPPPPRSGQSPQ